VPLAVCSGQWQLSLALNIPRIPLGACCWSALVHPFILCFLCSWYDCSDLAHALPAVRYGLQGLIIIIMLSLQACRDNLHP
jgi:hypothetical protein